MDTYSSKKNHSKIIFHIDVNNAFLSWTAVDLLAKGYDKDIRTIPAIIGGDESKRAGIVLAKSNPARIYDIKTAEPIVFALKKYPNLAIYPPNYALYNIMSDRLYNLFLKYTDKVERYSIDEAFLDVTEYLFKHTPEELAQIIYDDIFSSLKFAVNIGISDKKLFAKTASDFKKGSKIHTLYSEEIQEKLWPLDVSNLFTVGKKLEQNLKKLQIKTVGDLACFDKSLLEKRFR